MKREDIIDEIAKRNNTEKTSKKPQHVSNVEVTVSTYTLDARDFSRQVVQFSQPSDPNFNRVRVWMKGYQTDNELGTVGSSDNSLPFQLFAESETSPVVFITEATTEEVVIGVQAINEDGIGADLATMPTISTTLI